MKTMCAKGPGVVAVLMSGLLLAACGPAPAPAGEAGATFTGEANEPGTTAASARTAAATEGRDAPAPTRSAPAPGGLCPSTADEPAPVDGGREVTPAVESEAPVRDLVPAQD